MDHPRFQPVDGNHDELHRLHHGGRLVDLIFAIADTWKSIKAGTERHKSSTPGTSKTAPRAFTPLRFPGASIHDAGS